MSKKRILIVGGRGSGKTAIIAAMEKQCLDHEYITVLEAEKIRNEQKKKLAIETLNEIGKLQDQVKLPRIEAIKPTRAERRAKDRKNKKRGENDNYKPK